MKKNINYKKLTKWRNNISLFKDLEKGLIPLLYALIFLICVIKFGRFAFVIVLTLLILHICLKILFINKITIFNCLSQEVRNFEGREFLENIIDNNIESIVITDHYDIIPLIKHESYNNPYKKIIHDKDHIKHIVCCLDNKSFNKFINSKEFNIIQEIYKKNIINTEEESRINNIKRLI
ncbi:hypothetical protein [Anaerofustis butyriciformans]|uniref:hypothetical protein n=1 Tax=Anaerofustis butyriciformans TaxID=3108533 RepID=UPI002E2F994A|nr:hypothetical protein [Anaerofustis sp. HA2171]